MMADIVMDTVVIVEGIVVTIAVDTVAEVAEVVAEEAKCCER